MKPCSGLIVTSFSKTDLKRNFEDLPKVYEAYNQYKKVTHYPSGYNGNVAIA